MSYVIDNGYFDEVGGFHDTPLGWNPNGHFCGECMKKSCENCSQRDNPKTDTTEDMKGA